MQTNNLRNNFNCQFQIGRYFGLKTIGYKDIVDQTIIKNLKWKIFFKILGIRSSPY